MHAWPRGGWVRPASTDGRGRGTGSRRAGRRHGTARARVGGPGCSWERTFYAVPLPEGRGRRARPTRGGPALATACAAGWRLGGSAHAETAAAAPPIRALRAGRDPASTPRGGRLGGWAGAPPPQQVRCVPPSAAQEWTCLFLFLVLCVVRLCARRSASRAPRYAVRTLRCPAVRPGGVSVDTAADAGGRARLATAARAAQPSMDGSRAAPRRAAPRPSSTGWIQHTVVAGRPPDRSSTWPTLSSGTDRLGTRSGGR